MADYDAIAQKLYGSTPGVPTLASEPAPESALEPEGAQPANKYDAIANTLFNARMRTSVFAASDANPDVAARARKIAERTGMVPDAVERNMGAAERQVLVEDVDAHTVNSPVLRAAYGDLYFAKAAKDDLLTLTAVEKAVRRLLDPTADDRKQTRAAIGEVGSFLAEGVKRLGMGATVQFGAGIADAAGGVLDIAGRVTGVEGLTRQAARYQGIATRAREAAEYFSTKYQNDVAQGFMSGMESAGTSMAVLPVGIEAGATALVTTMASLVGWQSFTKARNKDQSVWDSLIYAAPDAAFEAAFEAIPASRLLGDIAKNSTLFTIFKNQLLPEVLGEQATTHLQDLNEWVRLNPTKTLDEFIAERPSAAVQTLVATLVGVGVQSGSVRAIQRVIGGPAEKEARAKEANAYANNLGELLSIAAGSRLRGRDAQTFAAFAQAAADADGDMAAQVHVDATILEEALQQANIDLETFAQMSPTAAEELKSAAQMGGSVAIPIGDLIGKMGDTKLEQALLPHLRASEDALSLEEAKAEQIAAQEMLQQRSEEIIKQAADSQALETSVESVREMMFTQLQSVGRWSADVNRAYSTLVGSFYKVLGSHMGLTPEQAYAAMPLRGQGVVPQGDALGQQTDIGAALQARIDADYDGAVAEYAALPDAKGGQVLNTDIARELSPEYRADRTRSAEVHEAASAFVKRMYADKLSKPVPEGKHPTVLFTGGGAGAGKSTGLRLLAESSDAEIVYDTNMSALDSSVQKIEQALSAGRNVAIMYVYRDPVDALTGGALSRAERSGRTVPLHVHGETHVGARKVVEQLMAKYADDPRVAVHLVDNSRGSGNAALTTLDKLPQIDENILGEKLREAVQTEYQAGRVSEAVARGTLGYAPNGSGQGGTGVRKQPQQADLPQATLSDFTRERLPGLLSKDGWAIFTSADPGAVKQSDEQNAVALDALRQDLAQLGLEYTEAIGKYGDTQLSFVVVGISEKTAQQLGNKYGQESILTRRGLVYSDGSVTPATGIDVFDDPPEDFYTELPDAGAYFSVQLDFDRRLAPNDSFAQSGRAEGDTRYRDRAIYLLSELSIPRKSAVAIMNGTKHVPHLPTNLDIARYFTTETTLDISQTKGMNTLVDALYADTIKALTDSGSAVGWYDRKVTAAFNILAEVHPELLTNDHARFGFTVMLAITSNSTKVNENFEKAEALYRSWKETGEWPVDVPDAKAADAMRKGLTLMQALVAQHGWEHVRDFMLADHPRHEIEAFSGNSISSELADASVYGAVFLGSKIGAFFNNLYGNFTPVTMDRWFMRSINRVRGSMLALPETLPTTLDILADQIRNGTELYGADRAGLLRELDAYKKSGIADVERALQALPQVTAYAKAKLAVFQRGVVDSEGKRHSFAPRTADNVTAKTVYEALTLDQQTPNGGGDRVLLRKAMRKVQSKLADAGIPMVMADLQAVLWYYEKDLFATLKKTPDERKQTNLFDDATAEAEDYETAARRVVRLLRGEESRDPGLGRSAERAVAKQRGAKQPKPVDPTPDLFRQSAVEGGDAGFASRSLAPVDRPVGAPQPTYRRGLTADELRKIDLAAIQAEAPSARVSDGAFQVLQSEQAAAAAVAAQYGVDLPSAGVLGHDRGTRGLFSPTTMTITLLENADLSTFLHETGHFMLEALASVAGRVDAPAQVREDMNELLKWFGVKDLQTWYALSLDAKRAHHEKFAESFEQYLFEGRAPSKELQPLFQRFASWFAHIYQSLQQFLRQHNTQLTDEVRAVFDRMLATKDQIAQKQEEMAYTDLFTDRPEGMTDDEFADWVFAQQMATATAEEELRTRSLRDLRWVINAKSREMVKLRKGVAEKRQAVEAEVRAEVEAMPVYAVQRWIKTGVLPDGTQQTGARMHTEDLRAIFGDGPAAPWRYLAANLISASREDTLHPDQIAELFGFTSGDQMVRDIVGAFAFEPTVQGLTDRRMLERFGDIASQRALDDAANAAVHNEYRAKVLMSELKAMTQATQPVRVLLSAAKNFAAQLIGRRRIKDVKPFEHERAEERAAKRAAKATAAGDLTAAAAAKRDQVLQFHAAKAAREALDEVRQARELFNRIVTAKDDTVGKTRDMDLVNATRAILANYGFGGKAKTAHDYLLILNEHDPAMYDTIHQRVIAAEQAGKPFNNLTMDELRALVDEVKSFWLLAKRSKQIEIDGKLVELREAREAITARVEALGIPVRIPGEGQAITPGEKRLNMLQTFIAAATRVEAWVTAKDGGARGPFRTYVFNTIKDAADRYRADRAAYARRYTDLLKTISSTLTRGTIDAREIGYTFGKGHGGVGMGELLHAILHTGNESNKRKLLLGRGWATENADGTLNTDAWDTFVERMQNEGKLTKAHYDFAQGVWDMLESTKAQAQKMHRDVFGRYFAEVTASAIDTPFGVYRGGYVPAMADPGVVSDAKTRALAEEENKSLAFAFPATNRGFTKSRVEYNRPLMLDLRTLSSHLDKVLMFSHLEGPVRDARKVLTGKNVAYALNRQDPVAFDSILTPWLNRTARQIVETPIAGDGGLMRFFSAARSHAGIAAMFANVSNAAQQLTGLSIAATQVPPRLLLSSIASYIAAPRDTANAVAEASLYMAGRMDHEVAAMHDAMNDILLDPSVYDKAKAWSRKHAYFLQAAVDNVIGPVVWTAARNHALEKGQSALEARRHADSVVRMTQGSTLPEDVSRIETGNAFVRTFTQFMGYFNMQANLNGAGLVNIARDVGLRAGAGKALYLLTFGALAPAWVAETIAQAFKGGPGDEDKDGWYLDDWLAAVFGFGTLRTAAAMIPVAGQVVNAAVNAANSKPYDDRIGSSPAIGMIEATVRAPVSVYKAIADDGSKQKAVRDLATAVSIVTGIPVTAVARPLGYAAAVQDGRAESTGPVDTARGLLTGSAGPRRDD
jgi:hypothetical protein